MDEQAIDMTENRPFAVTSNEKPLVVYVIAGEPSGDLLGAHLMRALKKLSSRRVVFYGVGGDKMEEEGLDSLFPYYELSLMGFVEVIPYIYRTLVRIQTTIADIQLKQPDIVITIDSPGFCFRVVEKLRKEQFKAKFVHYVAPTVWAYKPKRAEKCAKLFDHMLLLLPFEPPYFNEVGLPCTFVGHPVVCETKIGNGEAFRQKHEIPDTSPIFCLLPGSRKGEIKRHMPIFARAVAMLATSYPRLTLVVAVPDYVTDMLGEFLNKCPFRVIITEDESEKKNAIAASNFAFVKSGTVALEVAMAGTPMLVAYSVNRLTAWWMRKLILIKHVNLINILLKKEAIPELIQESANPIMLASCANQLLYDHKLKINQKNDIKRALTYLVPEGDTPPSEIAAGKILSLLS